MIDVNMDIVLTSERLNYKRITWEDFNQLCEILKDPQVMYAWEHEFTDEDVREWIQKRINSYKEKGYDYYLAIDKETGEVVGQIGLLEENVEGEHFFGLGYILKKQFWHKGYAVEGGKAMIDYSFNVLGKEKVIATIRPENISSCNVAKRLGMQVESEFVKVYNGKEMPHLVYSIYK